MTTLPMPPGSQSTNVRTFAPAPDAMPELHLRDARAADLPALAVLEAQFPSDRIGPPLFRELMGSPRAAVRVAELDGRLVGYHIVRRRWLSRIGWLYSLAVDADHRRRGIGRRLLADAERLARRAGGRGMQLEVRQDNAAALALYERCGYRRVKALPGYYDDGAAGWRYRREWP